MAAEELAPTSGEYIQHHLTHLSNIESASPLNFHVIHWDSVVFSSLIGLVFLFFGLLAARRATSGVPGRFQAAVEFMIEMVDSQAKAIVHNATSRKMVAPMATVLNLLGWTSVKLICTVAMLFAAGKVLHPIQFPALLLALAVCLTVYWVALAWRSR